MERQEDMQSRANIATVATVVIVVGAFYTSTLPMLWVALLTALIAVGCWKRSSVLMEAEMRRDASLAWSLDDFTREQEEQAQQHTANDDVSSHHQQYGQSAHYAHSLNWS